MNNPKRKVELIEKDLKGNIKRRCELSYIYPKGQLIIKKELLLQKYGKSKLIIEIFRSDHCASWIPLSEIYLRWIIQPGKKSA